MYIIMYTIIQNILKRIYVLKRFFCWLSDWFATFVIIQSKIVTRSRAESEVGVTFQFLISMNV